MVSTHINNQKGTLAFEIALGVLVLVALGAAGYFAYQARNQSPSAQVPTQHNSAKADSYQGWQTFTSKVNGLSFKYPSDWKSDISYQQDPGFSHEDGTITSPDGFEVVVHNPADGLGGACPDPCMIVTQTVSAEPISLLPGHKSYLVKQRVYDSSDKSDVGDKRIGIYEDVTHEDPFNVSQPSYQGYPPYLLFASPKQDSNPWIQGQYPKTNPKAQLDNASYFRLPDLQKAELLFKSVKFQ